MHLAVRQRRFDGVRALGEEPAGLVTLGAAGQFARSNNPGCPLGERISPGLCARV
ncbi:hypothetical protein AB5J62_13805 [Amycolatopsis sp. cg5]